MSRVLVTGARGKTGVPLAELLVARPNVEVLGGSRSPATAAIDGARPTEFSWNHPAGSPGATDGVDALYVVLPIRADAPELVGALLDRTPPEVHVVLLSERDADQVGPTGGPCGPRRSCAAAATAGRSCIRAGSCRSAPMHASTSTRSAVPESCRFAAVAPGCLDRRPGHRGGGRTRAAR